MKIQQKLFTIQSKGNLNTIPSFITPSYRNSKFCVMFFLSRLGSFGKGNIFKLKDLYESLPKDKQHLLCSFNIIHPNFYLRTRICCKAFFSNGSLYRKIHQYDTLHSFINDGSRDSFGGAGKKLKVLEEQNQKVNKLIIGNLPMEIFDIYIGEEENFRSKHSIS